MTQRYNQAPTATISNAHANRDIEDHERAVQEKATLDEQARLRQLEADRLNKETNSIKSK